MKFGWQQKIEQYISKWRERGYADGISDTAPTELERRRMAPSYRAIAYAILANDIPMRSLGFPTPRSDVYDGLKRTEIQARMRTPQLVDETWPRRRPRPRQPLKLGDHNVVSVTKAVHRAAVRLGFRREYDVPPNPGYLELGIAFERWLVSVLKDRDPGRFVSTGLLRRGALCGIPDLVDTDRWGIDEVKCTWMSSRHEPDSRKWWAYWAQLKAYCWMAKVPTGTLRVCHVVGDWRGSGPQYRVWRRKFERDELLANYRMLESEAQLILDKHATT